MLRLRRPASRSRRHVAAPFAAGVSAALLFGWAAVARAAPVWIGDFETGDLSQWDGALNGDHITVVGAPVVQGSSAARIELTNDAVWPNGLKRVELHHSPDPARTAEGAETWFAWSFQLPDELPTDPSQQIGYWESNQSYQQMMAFEVEGQLIRFITHKPSYQVHWEADGMVTPGVWHRIALHVKWSKDGGQGFVDVWFDGSQVVTQGAAQTLADDNAHFTQVGLLRGPADFQDAPVIFIDDAVEGDSVDDVHPALTSEGGGGGAGGAGTGGAAVGGGTPEGGSSGTGGSPQGQGGSTGGASSSPPAIDDSGCDCRVGRASDDRTGAAWAALLLGLALAARSRRRELKLAPRARDVRSR